MRFKTPDLWISSSAANGAMGLVKTSLANVVECCLISFYILSAMYSVAPSLTFTGSGMLTLPNTAQTINTTSNGTAIISFATSSGYAKETIRTENGETVTATAYEIVQFNNPAAAPEGGGTGIVTAVFQTNSTGVLARLNGVITAGIDDMSTSGESHVTLWRWENGNGGSSNNTASSNNSTGITPSSSPITQGETQYE